VPEQPQLRSVRHHFSEVAASAAASSSALVTPFQKPSDVFNKTSGANRPAGGGGGARGGPGGPGIGV